MRGLSKRESKTAELHTAEVRIFSEPLSFSLWPGRNVLGFIISRTFTQILVVSSPSAYRSHIAREHAFFLHAIYTMHSEFLPRTPASCLP